MKIYLTNPLFEYRKGLLGPFAWRGRWGGRLFWRYALPDLWGRWWSFRLKIGIPGVCLDI